MTSWFMSHFHHTLLKWDMNCFKPTDITHSLGLSQGSCTAAAWVFCFQSGTITCENLQYNRMPHQLFNMKLQCSHRRQGYRIGRVPALETSRNRSKPLLHLLLTMGERECVCVRVHAQSLSHVWLFATRWTIARQTHLLDPPGKNTRVGGHALLQGILPTQGLSLCLFYLLLS